ncbi:MAG TPA: HEAT repeat domain-containing protein [Gemmatimonadaceae bacterium]|nr:HEAT repeat domain-containing protein [Gemmatimonadaceae bacterium]
MPTATGDDRKAFLGAAVKYEFPDCCVVCLATTVERRHLRVIEPMRLVKTVRMSPVVHEYKYRDIEHIFTIPAVPYCSAHLPASNDRPELESHGLRMRARRQGGDPEVPDTDKHIEVDKVVFEFGNPDYAARFRAANGTPTPGERRRDIAKAMPGVMAELFKRKTWTKARLEQAAQHRNARALIRGLSHEDADVRRHALGMLNRAFGDRVPEEAPGARDGVAAMADDAKDWIRALALEILQRFGPSEDSLVVFLDAAQDEYEHARSRTAQALGDYPHERAVQALLALADDENEYVRGFAVESLGRRGDVGLDSIEQALNDESEIVRKIAARALGR